jgi:chemotaxis protein CheD
MEHYLKIAQTISAGRGDSIKTVVGSCIALCLCDIVKGMSGMTHIMMPRSLAYRSKDKDADPGKYADTGVPHLLKIMLDAGCDKSRLKAKICGGAAMFNTSLSMGIGRQNRDVVVETLKTYGLQLVFEDTGGTCGRTVVIECSTGQLFIRSLTGISKKG